MPILTFTDIARDRYRELLQQKIRIGSHDLRIAAIAPHQESALSVDGVLVTRNRRDFERIADLRIEDWSI